LTHNKFQPLHNRHVMPSPMLLVCSGLFWYTSKWNDCVWWKPYFAKYFNIALSQLWFYLLCCFILQSSLYFKNIVSMKQLDCEREQKLTPNCVLSTWRYFGTKIRLHQNKSIAFFFVKQPSGSSLVVAGAHTF